MAKPRWFRYLKRNRNFSGLDHWCADGRRGVRSWVPSHLPDEMRLSRWWLALFPVALAERDAFESLVVP